MHKYHMQFQAKEISLEMSFPVMVPGNSLIPARPTTCRTDPWFPWWQSEKLQRLLGKSAAIYWTAIFWCKHTMMGWTRLNVHKFYFWTVKCHGVLTIRIALKTTLTYVIWIAAASLKLGFPLLMLFYFCFKWPIPGLLTQSSAWLVSFLFTAKGRGSCLVLRLQ